MRAAGGEHFKLRLNALPFNLQLSASLFAQLFRMRTAHSRQTMLYILRLEIFFQLLQARLQLSLPCLCLSQLSPEICGAFLRALFREDAYGNQPDENRDFDNC